MSLKKLSPEKQVDLANAQRAMERAAKMAREIAIQTNTAIVVVRDGKPVRIPAEELRKEQQGE